MDSTLPWRSRHAFRPNDEERALVARLRRRDEAAFAELVEVNHERLTALAKRILRDDADAHDAVQTALAAAFVAIDGFDGRSRIATWLYRITANAALMTLRSRRRRPERSWSGQQLDSGPGWRRYLDMGLGADGNPETAAIHREQSLLLRQAVRSLRPEHRRVIEMRDLREMDTREVARQLALTANATKIRLYRARRALRQRYDDLLRGCQRDGPRA